MKTKFKVNKLKTELTLFDCKCVILYWRLFSELYRHCNIRSTVGNKYTPLHKQRER